MTLFIPARNGVRGVRRPLALLALIVAAAALGLTVAGCASTESDLPWATPASWEGSPQIPGMSGAQ